ncbi:MAG: hypothetical protein JWM28_3786 [Chitinophagaceae bacterium]|nr:hypothetical protein [Chitinophagaceae bacterium]
MQKKASSQKLRSAGKWILWVLLFQLVLINISASIHAWKFTHFYTGPEPGTAKSSSKNIFAKTWKLFSGIQFPRSVIISVPQFPIDTVQLKTKKGLVIDCWLGKPDSTVKGTVILFHGLSANKSYFLSYAAEFRYLGYNVMMVDLRGHGNSGGNITTLGFRESEEVKLAYDYITKTGEKNIFLWGFSLGAVIITKAINDYDIKPSGVILESPFASLQSHLEARSRVFGFPEEPFGFLVTAWVGIERGYYGFDHQVTQYVKKMNCPVLLQWGNQDQYVLPAETEAIFKNIASVNKKLVVYEKAGHQLLLGYDPEKWRQEVTALLQRAGPVHH